MRSIETTNALLPFVPPAERRGLRHVDAMVQRPASSLGALASLHEIELPRLVRWLTRGWGTREVRSNDVLSLLLFERGYVELLMGIGESDAAARHAELALRLVTSDGDFYRGTLAGLSKALTAAKHRHRFDVVAGPHGYAFNRGPGLYEMLLFHDRVLRGEPAP